MLRGGQILQYEHRLNSANDSRVLPSSTALLHPDPACLTSQNWSSYLDHSLLFESCGRALLEYVQVLLSSALHIRDRPSWKANWDIKYFSSMVVDQLPIYAVLI